MTKRLWIAAPCFVLTAAGVLAGCGSDTMPATAPTPIPSPPPAAPAPPTSEVAQSSKARIVAPPVASADLTELAADNDAFAVSLYGTLRANPGNMVFSPESISFALAMTYPGAAGETATQMASALHFELPPERLHPAFDALDLALTAPSSAPGAFTLALANALWAQRGFTLLPPFLDVLAENYGAGVRLVDFANASEPARQTINQWVSDQTAGKIPELLKMDDVSAATRVVLTNAVYFKADWQTPIAGNSTNGTFTTVAGPVTVPMMMGVTIPVWTGPGYTAGALPYAGGTTSMVVIVPDAGTFDTFEAGLTADLLSTITASQSAAGPGGVRMPRFKFDQHISLKQQLQALGMTDAFTSGLADLSGIDGAQDLYISDVIHEANIAVDEKGTEAAAATAVITKAGAAAPTSTNLIVDHPFLFPIRDDATGSILFMGRVLDPS